MHTYTSPIKTLFFAKHNDLLVQEDLRAIADLGWRLTGSQERLATRVYTFMRD